MDITRQTVEALTTGFKANFSEGRNKHVPMWKRVATEIKSTTAQNTYPHLGDVPGMREWIGDRQIKKLAEHDYTIKNRKFEQTLGVQADKIKDDEYGMYAPLFVGMGEAAAMWPDELVWDTVRNGFNAKCYDGQYFFDTDHPVYDTEGREIGTTSNMQAGAGSSWTLLNTKRALKPFIWQPREMPTELVFKNKPNDDNVFMRDEFLYGAAGRGNGGYGFWQMAFGSKANLDEINFKAARLAMRSLKDGRGRPVVNEPDLLVVGTANADAAEELLKKLRKQNGEDNVLAGAVELLVCPYLF